MNKNLLVLPLAVVLLAGCAGANEVKAEGEVPVKTQLQNLINEYIGDSGLYTKKTTICFTEEAMEESSKYFHANQVAPKRTTYYDTMNQRLLMAEPDGALDVSCGGYMFSGGKVSRFHTLEDSTLENMYSNIAVDFVQGEYDSLKAAYVTLETFAADDYFADFAHEDTFGTYYYNLQDGYAEDCQAYKDFLGFTAPMLKPTSKEYLHAKSLVINELHDANDTPYLSMKIYLTDEDVGKSTGECGTGALCEARIYKEHAIFAEDLSESFYYKVWSNEGVEQSKIRLAVNEDNKKELFAKDVQMNSGDKAKLYSTKRGLGFSDSYEHNLATNVQKSNSGDYKVLNSGSYDLYAKFEDETFETYTSTYFGYKFVEDATTRVIYLENNWKKSSLDFRVHYWGGSSGTEWDSTPYLVYDRTTDKDIYKVVIPADTTQVIFRHANWDGMTQTVDIKLTENNSFYFASSSGGKSTVGSYNFAK